MLMLVKAYRVFDKLFVNEALAEKEIDGWEHKESIKVYWLAVDGLENVPQVIEFDEINDYVVGFDTNFSNAAEILFEHDREEKEGLQ